MMSMYSGLRAHVREALFGCCVGGDSVTDNFLLEISATPPRAVALRLSNPSHLAQ